MIRRITPPPLKNLCFCLQVKDIIVDVEEALISTGEALRNLLLSKNYATHYDGGLFSGRLKPEGDDGE